MKKTAILTGLLGPWTGEVPAGTEVWSVNRGHRGHKQLDRLFLFHEPEEVTPDDTEKYIEEVNNTGARVLMRSPDARIPRAEPYPARRVIQHFGLAYFTSSFCWMLALALAERFDRIVMHRIHSAEWCPEYFGQKAALDFWLGVAVGRNVRVVLSSDSVLARAHPWETNYYGYVKRQGADHVGMLLHRTIKAARTIPVKFKPTPEAGDLIGIELPTVKRYPAPRPAPPPRKRVFNPSRGLILPDGRPLNGLGR